MKHHPIADLFPMMNQAELAELAADIKVHGQRYPVITFEGKILDGRNRSAACLMAGESPAYEEYKGKDPLGYVLSHNLHRRHLSTEQRAEIAAKIAQLGEGRPKTTPNGGVPISQKAAAAKLNVSVRSVQRAKAKISPKAPAEPESWTVAEVMEDPDLLTALKSISSVYGKEDTKAIREGTIGLKRAEIIELGGLSAEVMMEYRDLIMANRWTPKRCAAFLKTMPDGKTTCTEMANFCLATKEKQFVADIDGFRHSVSPVTKR